MERICRAALVVLVVAASLVTLPVWAGTAPANDKFESARLIEDLPYFDNVDISLATREAVELPCSSEDGVSMYERTIWYRYTPSNDLELLIQSRKLSPSIDVGLYLAANSLSIPVSCGRGNGGRPVSVNLIAGQEYYFQVSSYWAGTIDMAFFSPGSVSGVVTDDLGNPLVGICVTVSGQHNYGTAETDSYGNYSIGALGPGDVTVRFYECAGGDSSYLAEYYDDSGTQATATKVNLGSGTHVTGIDASLAPAAVIRGKVLKPEGAGRVCVQAINTQGTGAGYGSESASGEYRIGGIPSSDYKIYFYGCLFEYKPVNSEWYLDKPDYSQADPIPVTAGSVTYLQDAQLSAPASPSNDYAADAKPIRSFPLVEEVDLRWASPEEDPAPPFLPQEPFPSCGWSVDASVWYSIQVTEPTTVIASTDSNKSGLVLAFWTQPDGVRFHEEACGASGAQAPFAGVRAQPGTTYLLQVGSFSPLPPGPFTINVDKTMGGGDLILRASTPCATLCPYWDQTKSYEQQHEASCAPSPNSPSGSWTDTVVTVPSASEFGGRTPEYLAFSLEPQIDWDAFICRKTPDSNGIYYISTSARSLRSRCPLAPVACIETAVIRVSPGETYVLRAYNWLGEPRVSGNYSFGFKP